MSRESINAYNQGYSAGWNAALNAALNITESILKWKDSHPGCELTYEDIFGEDDFVKVPIPRHC